MSYAPPKTDPSYHSGESSVIPQEPTGSIAADSLAAESIEAGGAFADNENANPLGFKGASSTLATTDTSGATELPPGEDREARDDIKDESVKYPDDSDKAQFSGSHSADYGYTGGPSQTDSTTITTTSGTDSSNVTDPTDTTSSATTATEAGANAAGVRPYVDQAPNYTGTVSGSIRSEGELKPKGTGLVDANPTSEGGDDSMPDMKTFTGDVGGVHDPAREAEQKMFSQDAALPGEGVGGIRQSEVKEGTGMFDALQSSERA